MRGRGAAALAAALIVAAALLASPPLVATAAAQDLDAYRALARGAAGTRLAALARAAMLAHWGEAAPDTAGVPDWPAAPSGVFVSLVRGASTRACVGSVTPRGGSLAETVRALAEEALNADRRRPPLRREELDSLGIVLAFTGPERTLADPMRMNPAREGLLVSSPRGQIAFLPGEARTVAWALREARRVGILRSAAPDAWYASFDVVVLRESAPRPVRKEGNDAVP